MTNIDNDTMLPLDDEDEVAPEQEEQDNLEAQLEQEEIVQTIKLDYTLKSCEERAGLVNKIVEQTPPERLTKRYLEILGDYIMGGITKEEKKSHIYMTDNRRITIDKRETSFEGLIEKFENGEDGIYNLMSNDKNIIFQHKQEITEEDLEKVPGLRQLHDEIVKIEAAAKAATGKNKYLLRKQLIEMRKDQYVLKNSFANPIRVMSRKGGAKIDLDERRYLDQDGQPQSTGLISFFNPDHISAMLCVYPILKHEMQGRFQNDFYYLVQDFEGLLKRALVDYPMYRDIVVMKFNDLSNAEIQERIKKKYNEVHSAQFISSLWRQKIPKIIAEREQEDFIIQYYKENKPNSFKRCSCCKEKKPACTRFFSKNNTAKDGFYSLCKECRKARKK